MTYYFASARKYIIIIIIIGEYLIDMSTKPVGYQDKTRAPHTHLRDDTWHDNFADRNREIVIATYKLERFPFENVTTDAKVGVRLCIYKKRKRLLPLGQNEISHRARTASRESKERVYIYILEPATINLCLPTYLARTHLYKYTSIHMVED